MVNDGLTYERGALRWAVGVTATVAVTTALSLGLVSVDTAKNRRADSDVIYVEFLPEPAPPAPVTPPARKPAETPRHERVAERDNTRQATGRQEQTRTANPRALFKMTQGGSERSVNAGNPNAGQAERDMASGSGGGLNPVGTDMLDEGLLGRGVVGELPQPAYPAGNRGGKVVVRVAVDRSGNVTDAIYEPKGSTTSDAELVRAALEAARRAKFAESRAFIQGGTITSILR